MLTELRISNFAIIAEESVAFGEGLNVISGETGAGKSIVLHALEFILGRKPATHALRAGAEALEVQAIFDLSRVSAEIREALPDAAREGNELLLARTLSAAGRNKVQINGRLGTVGLLEEISSRLINICGQNQQIRLLDPAHHQELLDGYGRYTAAIERYRGGWREWSEARDALARAESALRRDEDRQAQLALIVEELEPLGLRAGIRSELEAESKRLGAAEHLIEGGRAFDELFESEQGIFAQLGVAGSRLGELARFDQRLAELASCFQSIRSELKEVAGDISTHIARVTVDEERLEQIRHRLAEIARLERKHRTNDEGLCRLLAESLESLGPRDGSTIDDLRRRESALREVVVEAGSALSEARRTAARQLAREVQRELRELNMGEARLEVHLETHEAGPHGCERIEFRIQTNAGEPPRPLRLVASGGELSRLTLVLKKILRDRTGVNILVFDEVDAGISGSVARGVGEKLKELARESQVICITHLPQVASLADHHFLVTKVSGKRTTSRIREIGVEERVDEIARMLAGYDISPAARASARELLASK